MIFFDKSPFATAMVTSAMLRTCAVRFEAIEFTRLGEVLPHAGHFMHLRLAAELALGAHLARHARHFRGEHAELLDHGVHDGGGLQELALQRAAFNVHAHGFQQVALRHGGYRAGHFAGRPEQIVDQGVDGVFHLRPGAAGGAELHALFGLTFLADHLADAVELLRHAFIGGGDLVKSVGNLALDPEVVAR